jgi:hypothetical protein
MNFTFAVQRGLFIARAFSTDALRAEQQVRSDGLLPDLGLLPVDRSSIADVDALAVPRRGQRIPIESLRLAEEARQ